MASLEQRLKELRLKAKEYDFIVKKLFDNPLALTDEERESFIQANTQKIQELQAIRDEIIEINWKLMGSVKQKQYLDKYSEE